MKTEDRRQKTEDRRQKTEDRRQKTEDGRRKTEDGRQEWGGERWEKEVYARTSSNHPTNKDKKASPDRS